MDEKTHYAYQKRIRELEAERDRLYPYRTACLRIFDGLNEVNPNGLKTAWLYQQFRELFK